MILLTAQIILAAITLIPGAVFYFGRGVYVKNPESFLGKNVGLPLIIFGGFMAAAALLNILL